MQSRNLLTTWPEFHLMGDFKLNEVLQLTLTIALSLHVFSLTCILFLNLFFFFNLRKLLAVKDCCFEVTFKNAYSFDSTQQVRLHSSPSSHPDKLHVNLLWFYDLGKWGTHGTLCDFPSSFYLQTLQFLLI